MAADPSTSTLLLAPHKRIACRKWFHSRSPSHRKSRPWHRAHLTLPSRMEAPPPQPGREGSDRAIDLHALLGSSRSLPGWWWARGGEVMNAAGVVVGKGWRGYECRRQGEGFCHSSMQLCSAPDSSHPGPHPHRTPVISLWGHRCVLLCWKCLVIKLASEHTQVTIESRWIQLP